jgi:hypothetical protein
MPSNTATNVTFTFMDNSVAVGNSTPVRFAANTNLGLALTNTTTDGNGQVTISLTAPTSGTYTVSAEIDGQTVAFDITVSTVYALSIGTPSFDRTSFVTGAAASEFKSTASLTATVTKDGVPQTVNSGDIGDVVWSIVATKNTGINPASGASTWWKARSGLGFNTFGLAWGASGPADPGTDTMGTAPNGTAAYLTDIVGSRSVVVTAGVCVGGSGATSETSCHSNSGTWYSADQTVTFGAGPLSKFTTDPSNGVGKKWADKDGAGAPSNTGNGDFATNSGSDFEAVFAVSGTVNTTGFTYSGTAVPNYQVTAWPSSDWVAGEIGASGNISAGHYSTSSNLPKISQLKAVSKVTGQGAAFAAGWPDDSANSGGYHYWSGEVAFNGGTGHFVARLVTLDDGNDAWLYVYGGYPVAVGVAP